MAERALRYDAVIAAPFGRLGVVMHGEALVAIDFLPGGVPLTPAGTAAARRVCRQLRAYLEDPRAAFDLPLALRGTPYQRRVWRALRRIPPGRVLTYGELARRLKTGARAVGRACQANPMPIVVPCHRVVATDSAGGFMGRRRGAAIALKRWLLAHERAG